MTAMILKFVRHTDGVNIVRVSCFSSNICLNFTDLMCSWFKDAFLRMNLNEEMGKAVLLQTLWFQFVINSKPVVKLQGKLVLTHAELGCYERHQCSIQPLLLDGLFNAFPNGKQQIIHFLSCRSGLSVGGHPCWYTKCHAVWRNVQQPDWRCSERENKASFFFVLVKYEMSHVQLGNGPGTTPVYWIRNKA